MKKTLLVSILLTSSLFILSACGGTESAANISEANEPDIIVDVAAATTGEAVSINSVIGNTAAGEDLKVGDIKIIEPSLVAKADSLEVDGASPKNLTIPANPGKWKFITGYVGDGYGPGDKIRADFDYSSVCGEFFPDIAQENWKRVVMVTASNGVSVKAITFDENVEDSNGNIVRNAAYLPICDGEGKDLEPTSPFMNAYNEIYYTSWAPIGHDFSVASDAVLPVTTFKRDSLDVNDASLQAFKLAMDKKRAQVDGREYYDKSQNGILVNDQVSLFYDGIMEMDSCGSILWWFRRVGDYWEFKISKVPKEYQWAAIKNVFHYLTPDGDDLYQLFYDDFYFGCDDVLPTYDDWYPYGSSQVMIEDTRNRGHVIYDFK